MLLFILDKIAQCLGYIKKPSIQFDKRLAGPHFSQKKPSCHSAASTFSLERLQEELSSYSLLGFAVSLFIFRRKVMIFFPFDEKL
jgi:hypothetical protein